MPYVTTGVANNKGSLDRFRHYLSFCQFRAKAELKRDSTNMFLGSAWWIIEPIIYMAVFYVVFGLGLRKGGTEFVCYLLCGLVPWKWFDSTIKTASGTVVASAGLMRQVYFPKWILPSYIVLANTYKFFIVFALLAITLQLINTNASWIWLWSFPIISLQLLLIFGLSVLTASLIPLIPDLRYVVNYGMTLLFLVSGIFFSIDDLAEPVRSWLTWLPSVLLIDMYRDVLLHNMAPNTVKILVLLIQSLIFTSIGVCLLHKLDRYYPRVVG